MQIDPNNGKDRTQKGPFQALRSVEDESLQPRTDRRRKKVRRSRSADDEGNWADAKRLDKQKIRRLRGVFLIVGIILALLAGTAAVLTRKNRSGGNQASATSYRAPVEEDFPGSVIPKTTILSTKEAVEKTKQLLASRDEAEIKSLIRKGKMSPREAVDFLEKFPHANEIHWVGNMASLEVSTMALMVVPAGGPYHVIFFRPETNGEWKIDFDAFARYSEHPVEDFMEGRINGGVYRIVAAGDTYYNGPYVDEKVWRCFLLKSPDHETAVYAYCRRDSAQYQALLELESFAAARNSESGRESALGGVVSFRATLGLERKPGADDRQVEIVSFVADDWLIPDSEIPSKEGTE